MLLSVSMCVSTSCASKRTLLSGVLRSSETSDGLLVASTSSFAYWGAEKAGSSSFGRLT